MKTIAEIDRMVAIADTLTEEQKKQLRNDMLENDEAMEKVIRGLIASGNYGLAFSLVLSKCA